MNEIARNRLYYGDNLDILSPHAEHTAPIADESIDLVYLDPPFNSNRAYSVIFREKTGENSVAQIQAFEDSWHWNECAEQTLHELPAMAPANVVDLLNGLVQSLKRNDVSAYLVMLAPRLVQMYRVLKPTGTLWFHCDPTASHYIKLLLDSIFGARNYVNEVVTKRTSAHSDVMQGAKHCGRIHDTLLIYAKSASEHYWQVMYQDYDLDYINAFYVYVEYPDGTIYRITDPGNGVLRELGGKSAIIDLDFDSNGRRLRLDNLTAAKPGGDTEYEWKGRKPYKGRYWAYSKEKMEEFDKEGRLYYPRKGGTPQYKRYLDEMPGVPLQDMWADIRPPSRSEQLGFKTQKPLALLKRIIETACPKDGVVLDPFCGCGTTICAAQELNRQWIGIDITYLAILVIKQRLADLFGNRVQFDEEGAPRDLAGAQALARKDKYQFQWWVCDLVGARPASHPHKPKKGPDEGVDGVIYFYTNSSNRQQAIKAVVQVKGGENVSPEDIRSFNTVIDDQAASFGFFATLSPPTRGMKQVAAQQGKVQTLGIPKLQIRTVEELLQGIGFKRPTLAVDTSFKRAKREAKPKVTPKWMLEDLEEET